MKAAAFSFRNLPASIYLAVGLTVIGSVVYSVAFLTSSAEGVERFHDVARVRMFNIGCQYAEVFLYSLGVMALARRYTGPARPLAQTAAWLMFISLGIPFSNMVLSIIEPRDPAGAADLVGMVEGLVQLAATILLTIAADAWRRVLPAAILAILLHVTTYSFPIIGELITDAFAGDHTSLRIYYIFRSLLWGATMLFVAAALAAGGRDQPPEPDRAASGFAIAHVSLIIRLVTAATLAVLGFAAAGPGVAKLILIGGPLVVIGTQIVLAIGILRVDAAGLPGMPRFRLAVAAAGMFWFSSLQLEQVTVMLSQLWDGDLDRRDLDELQMFSVIGPIVAAISLALIGSAIRTFATTRGNQELANSASSRTFAFVGLALGGIALQAFMFDARTASSLLVVALLAAAAGISALVILAGLLKRAAEQINDEPGIPPARIVSDS
ncbi:MAG TPA: hypothetical protein VIU61_09195 [Kofleriaceae bacterium]